MKKLLNTAFIYALAAMAGGVFYREFTKFNGFSGRTALGLVHTHLFLLGTVFFLLAALFSKELDWARCCFSKRMRKVFRKNEKSMLQNCNKKAKRKGRLQRVKKPM